MARFILKYRCYNFVDKDPVIDEVRTVIQDEGLMKKLTIVHQLSGVATSTLENWFKGDTKQPRNSTVSAVVNALGYKRQFVKDHELDIDSELEAAGKWMARQKIARDKAKAQTNGKGSKK